MKKPMPLSELPKHLKSNNNEIPVVDIGQIVDKKNFRWKLSHTLILSTILFLTIGTFSFALNNTEEIIISSKYDISNITDIVNEEGGNIFYVKEKDGFYKIRIFSFKKNLIDKLKKRMNIK